MFALLKATLLLLNREWERNFSKKFRVGGTIQPTISTKSHKKKQTNMSPIFIVCKYLISRNNNQHHQSWGERASEQIVWPIFVTANFPKHCSIGSIWVCSDTPTTDTALFSRIYSSLMDEVEVDTEKRFRKWTRVESPFTNHHIVFIFAKSGFPLYSFSRECSDFESNRFPADQLVSAIQVKWSLNFWIEKFYSSFKRKKSFLGRLLVAAQPEGGEGGW